MIPFSNRKKQLQHELDELRDQYRNLIEYLPDAFLEVDILKPRLAYMNRSAFQLFGYTQEDLDAGINIADLFDNDDYERAFEIAASYVKKNIESKLPYEPESEQVIYEFLMKRKDGSSFFAETQTSFVLDEKGIPIAMRTVIRDVTNRKKAEQEKLKAKEAEAKAKAIEKINKQLAKEISVRKKAESALRESEEKYRQLYENTPSMYFTIDTKGTVLSVNKFGATQLGYEVEELVGQSVECVFHQEDKATFKKQLATSIQNLDQIHQWEIRKLRKNGSVMWVREVARAIRDSDNRVIIFIVCDDITEIKKTEEEREKLQAQLQHTQKLESLGELAGGIAHKFNNLLTGILGNASLALMDLHENSNLTETIRLIEKSALQASELTNQMLAYAGKGKYVVKAYNLSKIIEEMADLVETVVPKTVEIDYDLEFNLPDMEADSNQIQQVIMNLIKNSADAIGKKAGVIQVSTGKIDVDSSYFSETILGEKLSAGEYVYVEIKDTGCGIDKETQSKIFDPFFSTKFIGRGLGLAAVLGIVRSHRGAIKLESETKKGTSFRIIFPAIVKSIKPKSHTTKTEINGQTATILIIDDEEIARSVAKKTLEKFGFTVLLAKDGHEGLEVFRKQANTINGVLLDMTMPKMSGEETLEEMRRTDPNVPVILSSGFNEKTAVAKFADKGLAGFIQKPYQPRDLVSKFNQALQN